MLTNIGEVKIHLILIIVNGEPNPLNPGLDKFGNNISILASTYYIQSDKVAISPYRERF